MIKSSQIVIERAIKWNKEHKERRKQINKKYIENNYDKVKANRDKQNAKRTPEYFHEMTQRTFSFKGKHIVVKEKIRKGVCTSCDRSIINGEIKYTNLHHTKYDPNNPLAHTIELCVRCHNKEHGRYNGE